MATSRLIGALLLAAGAQAQAAEAVSPEQLFERLSPSVWTVETYDARREPLATGSAVVVGPGRLVTNCHVLAKAQRVQVARGNVSFGASLEHADPERDLCSLKVANFKAPAVAIASAEGVKIGSRVYAIGSPHGLEQTLSDGLLSGIRRSSSGDFIALQVSVPISPGSSGGGLFDAQGRLIGITTFTMKDGQNLNFAVPATWVEELPKRAEAALAAARTDPRSGKAAGGLAPGLVFEYRLSDQASNQVRTVIYRLDRVDGERLVFNQGGRIESLAGAVLSNTARIGGDFDVAMPPGGWIAGELKPGATWSAKYRSGATGQVVGMDIRARVVGESTIAFKDRDLRVMQVEITGYTERGHGLGTNPTGRYKATAWFSPELLRIVRFEAAARGGVGGAAYYVNEQLQLVDIRNE